MFTNKRQQINYIALSACLLLTLLSPGVFMNDFTFREHLFCLFALILGTLLAFSKQRFLKIDFSHLTVLFGIIFMCISDCKNWGWYQIYWISCAILIICLSQLKINLSNLLFIVSLLFVYELVLCVSQITKLLKSYDGMVTGSFDNPAGLCSFLTISIPLFFVGYCRCRRHKVFYFSLLISALIIIIYAKIRFALLALSIMGLFYVIRHKKIAFISYSVLCFIILGFLFFIKNQSTLGRGFILYNTLQLCGSNFLLGNGINYFSQKYMTTQAYFFHNNPNSEYVWLADNIAHPLNEYLMMYLSFGVVGVLIVVFFLYQLWKSWNQEKLVWHVMLFCIFFMSAFSYCLHYSNLLFFSIVALSQIHTNRIIVIRYRYLSRLIILIVSIFVGVQTIQSAVFEYKWRDTSYKKANNSNLSLYREYEKLEKKWNGNPLFYYDYAYVLSNNYYHEKSISKLMIYNKFNVSYNSKLLMAQNYYDIEMYDNALSSYYEAHWMCPNRFIPLQGIMRTYKALKKNHKAIEIAKEIKRKQIKINSYTVTLVKKEAEALLKENYEK